MIQRMFVTLDTRKTNYKNVGKINHGDDLILELTVLSDGDMISFNNPMVDLLVKKSDGKMIRQNSGIEHIQPNKFIIEVKKDCVTSPGLATNQLVINDNGRISTCMFYYTILNSLEEDVIQSISSVEVLEQLDEYVIDARERMELLNNGIKELEELFGATSDNLVEAEMARNEAEQIRVQSETLRVNNEKDRIEADNIRNQNEVDRSSSELVREQRESERILNEEERCQNESERMIDESTRQQNESVRQSNESVRISNENDRKNQENRRVTAETNRVNAETIRRNNENSRISNETERQKAMNEMKSLLEDARRFDDRVGVIEDDIEEINSSLDNLESEVNELKELKEGNINIDLTNYVTKSELSTKADKTELHSHTNKTVLDGISSAKVTEWDNKSNFSGNYNDLTNKPTIPTLNGYATEQYVNEEIDKIDVTDQLTDYAKKSELHSHSNKSVLDGITSTKVTEWDNKSNFSGNYNNLTNKPTIPTKTSQLTNDSGFITSIPSEYVTETELNNKGYLTQHQNLDNYYTKTETYSKSEVDTKTSELSSEIINETNARQQAISSLNERLGQQTVFVAEGLTQEESEAWLEENGDTTKLYLMPDGTFWQNKVTTEVVEDGATYTNLLPLAKDTDRTTIYNGKGYKENTKLSGSGGGESTSGSGKEALCATGFIFPVKAGDILRIKGVVPVTTSNHYIVGYDSSNTRTGHDAINFANNPDGTLYWTTGSSSGKYTIENNDLNNPKGATIVYTINTDKLGANVNTVRITGGMDENTIITLNEEIKEGGGTTTVNVEKWVSTGHGLIATEYDEVIAELNNIVAVHTEEINTLKQGVGNGASLTDEEKLEAIKTWDVPIYDAHVSVFELSTEKNAITEAEKSVASVYAKYDSLMAKYPNYITKTDLGLCSDGVTHVYRYDFREPEPHIGITGKKEWSETKTKAIIVSGIHWEWGGIFSLYNALEEIAENPKLFDLRRNAHLIVLPVCNPYAVANMSVRNANLVEIHRNFEVDFIYRGEAGFIEYGERSYGGEEPLSEVETQYIDNIMKENTDSALFLTCHSNQSDTVYGTGFTWASPATYYMCNLHYRLVDKLSKSWMDRFGESLEQGIADYRTENTPEWDTRLGSAYLSTTNGTETKQATKYGIQATNVEVCDTFLVHGTKANPESALSSFTISRGAETYINFLLTAFGVYDYKDKEQYYKK